MCNLFSRPKPPPAPAKEPADSAIEETADKVVTGTQKKKAKDTQISMGRKAGTKSLQIPLLDGNKGGDLNYPA